MENQEQIDMINPGSLSIMERSELRYILDDESQKHGIALRANVILLLDDGESYEDVAKAFYINENIIRHWHHIYSKKGMRSLLNDECNILMI